MSRNYCKFILILLTCAAPMTAVLVNAQQENGTPNGRFVLSGSNAQASGPAANNKRAFIGDAEAQTRLDALISGGAKSKPDSESAERTQDASQNASTRRPTTDALGAEEGSSASVATNDNQEYTWIAAVAILGLAVSLAATGYLAWTRRQPSNAAVAAFMPQALPRLPRDAANLPMAEKETRPERRAA